MALVFTWKSCFFIFFTLKLHLRANRPQQSRVSISVLWDKLLLVRLLSYSLLFLRIEGNCQDPSRSRCRSQHWEQSEKNSRTAGSVRRYVIRLKPSAPSTIFVAEDEEFRRWGRRFLSLATKTCCVREIQVKDFCRWRRSSISNMLEALFRRWRKKTRSLLPATKIVLCALGLRYITVQYNVK